MPCNKVQTTAFVPCGGQTQPIRRTNEPQSLTFDAGISSPAGCTFATIAAVLVFLARSTVLAWVAFARRRVCRLYRHAHNYAHEIHSAYAYFS